jgi:hypothetical protein
MGKSDSDKLSLSDAWARFERAVDVVVKSPPQHRTAETKKTQKRQKNAAKRRVSSSKQ